MEFIYLFDLLKFDIKGDICETQKCDENKARANYLYLLSKYNQKLINKTEKLPDFFKNEMDNIMQNVEAGGDFEKAKKLVLENCKKEVQDLAKNSRGDRGLICRLNELMIANESEFANEFRRAVNNIQLAYIITSISGKIFEEILDLQHRENLSIKDRSKMFKRVIDYNCLIKMAALVKENKLSKENLCQETEPEKTEIFFKKILANTWQI